MWVDGNLTLNHKPLDDKYRSIHLMLIHEIYVLELRVEMNVYSSHSF